MVGETQWVTNQLLKNQRLVAKVALPASCQHLKLNGKPTPLADWNRFFCFSFRKKCILIAAHYFCWHKTIWRILFLILHSKVVLVGNGANTDQYKYFPYGSPPLPRPEDQASCEGFSNFSFISFRPWFGFRGLFGSSKFSKPSPMIGHLKSKMDNLQSLSLQKNTFIYFARFQPVDKIHTSPIAIVIVRWWVWFECFAAFKSQLSGQTRTIH